MHDWYWQIDTSLILLSFLNFCDFCLAPSLARSLCVISKIADSTGTVLPLIGLLVTDLSFTPNFKNFTCIHEKFLQVYLKSEVCPES